MSTTSHNATHCNTLQHTATHCTTLHHTAPHCNALQQVLIFSQFKDMLSILERYLTLVGHAFVRIDGNVPSEERQRRIDHFNDKQAAVFVFLLSTRAGGQGINLTAADTVVVYDSVCVCVGGGSSSTSVLLFDSVSDSIHGRIVLQKSPIKEAIFCTSSTGRARQPCRPRSLLKIIGLFCKRAL